MPKQVLASTQLFPSIYNLHHSKSSDLKLDITSTKDNQIERQRVSYLHQLVKPSLKNSSSPLIKSGRAECMEEDWQQS